MSRNHGPTASDGTVGQKERGNVYHHLSLPTPSPPHPSLPPPPPLPPTPWAYQYQVLVSSLVPTPNAFRDVADCAVQCRGRHVLSVLANNE